jgi:hypothetical protein
MRFAVASGFLVCGDARIYLKIAERLAVHVFARHFRESGNPATLSF